MIETKRANTTIRLTKEERTEFEDKMKEYGYTEMSPFIRFAIRQLRTKRRDTASISNANLP